MKTPRQTITLRLDQAVVERIDEVRQQLRMTRSGWLRKAVARNLQHNTEHDLPVAGQKDIQAALLPERI
jgi:predicted transcriptional regulator